jgi:hypothetical protein
MILISESVVRSDIFLMSLSKLSDMALRNVSILAFTLPRSLAFSSGVCSGSNLSLAAFSRARLSLACLALLARLAVSDASVTP